MTPYRTEAPPQPRRAPEPPRWRHGWNLAATGIVVAIGWVGAAIQGDTPRQLAARTAFSAAFSLIWYYGWNASEVRHAVLRRWILAVLSHGRAMHGAAIAERIAVATVKSLDPGQAIYSHLRRMEREGWLVSWWDPETPAAALADRGGRPRRLYARRPS